MEGATVQVVKTRKHFHKVSRRNEYEIKGYNDNESFKGKLSREKIPIFTLTLNE